MTSLSPRDIADLKKEILSSFHCAVPGTVVSYDASARTAVIRPAVKRGGREMPLLRDVPVFMDTQRTIMAGASCLLVFADGDIDAWYASGFAEEPASGRQHDLSDAFAFVGFRDEPDPPLPVDASVVVDLIYPVGSIYMSVNNVSPDTLFAGTEWVQIKDRFLLSAGDNHANGATGGAESIRYTPGGSVGNHTLVVSEIPGHAHGLNSHTHKYVKATGTGGNSGKTASGGGDLNDYNAYALLTGTGDGQADWIEKNTGLSSWTANYGVKGSSGGSRSASHGYGVKLTGSIAHTHGLNAHTHSVTTSSVDTDAAGGNTASKGGDGAHNHGWTGTQATLATMPPYLTVYMWKRTA